MKIYKPVYFILLLLHSVFMVRATSAEIYGEHASSSSSQLKFQGGQRSGQMKTETHQVFFDNTKSNSLASIRAPVKTSSTESKEDRIGQDDIIVSFYNENNESSSNPELKKVQKYTRVDAELAEEIINGRIKKENKIYNIFAKNGDLRHVYCSVYNGYYVLWNDGSIAKIASKRNRRIGVRDGSKIYKKLNRIIKDMNKRILKRSVELIPIDEDKLILDNLSLRAIDIAIVDEKSALSYIQSNPKTEYKNMGLRPICNARTGRPKNSPEWVRMIGISMLAFDQSIQAVSAV